MISLSKRKRVISLVMQKTAAPSFMQNMLGKAADKGMADQEYKNLMESLRKQGFSDELIKGMKRSGAAGVDAPVEATLKQKAVDFVKNNKGKLGLGAAGVVGTGLAVRHFRNKSMQAAQEQAAAQEQQGF